MKIMVIGAGGFIGRHVCEALAPEHELIKTTSSEKIDDMERIDLLDGNSILEILEKRLPEVIINCAGVISNDENAQRNVIFTKNLLSAVNGSGIKPRNIVLAGSASVYGLVDRLPVSEDAPLNPTSTYGKYKVAEEEAAVRLAEEYRLPLVIARIFNPIGIGMNEQQLLPSLIRQLKAIRNKEANSIEVSRLDSRRDYIDVRDVASAIKVLAEGQPEFAMYNVGTGKSASSKQLIELILDHNNIADYVELKETQQEPEARVATQADITRIKSEFNWLPNFEITQTVKEIVHAANN